MARPPRRRRRPNRRRSRAAAPRRQSARRCPSRDRSRSARYGRAHAAARSARPGEPKFRRFGISRGGRSTGRSGRAGRDGGAASPSGSVTGGARRGQRPARRNFARRIGGAEDCGRAGGQSVGDRRDDGRMPIAPGAHRQRACAAFSTSATWPGTWTLCHTPRTIAARRSERWRARSPCICGRTCFSRPRRRSSRQTLPSPSEPRMNGSSCFFLNLSCEATESLEMPITAAPACRNPGTSRESRRPRRCSPRCRPSDRNTAPPFCRASSDKVDRAVAVGRQGEIGGFSPGSTLMLAAFSCRFGRLAPDAPRRLLDQALVPGR